MKKKLEYVRLEHGVPENGVFYLGRFVLQQASRSLLLWQQPKNVKEDSNVDPFSGAVMNENIPTLDYQIVVGLHQSINLTISQGCAKLFFLSMYLFLSVCS